MKQKLMSVTVVAALAATQVVAEENAEHEDGASTVASGLVLPRMDPANGRALYAAKGCVVCHSVNGVGGEDAPPLDAEYMDQPMNPFEFAARMWRGAAAMVELQEEELGEQIDLSGEELADIIAFVHDAEEQAKFSEADIPEEIEDMMHHESGEEDVHDEEEEDDHGDEEEEEDDHGDEEEEEDDHGDEEEEEDDHG